MKPWTIFSFIAVAALSEANAFELSIPCTFSFPVKVAAGTEWHVWQYTQSNPFQADSVAPDFYAVKVNADNFSRFVVSRLKWVDEAKFDIFLWNKGLSFEFEIIFYNYDDAAQTGFGPAYVLDSRGKFPSYCELPNCYRDTQFLSEKNNAGEYREVNLAFGSYDMSGYNGQTLHTYHTYLIGSRATTDRGNKSLMKVNYQIVYNTLLGVDTPANMFRCSNSNDFNIVRFSDRIYAPTCIDNYGTPAAGSRWHQCP